MSRASYWFDIMVTRVFSCDLLVGAAEVAICCPSGR